MAGISGIAVDGVRVVVTGDVREAMEYEGRGDERRATGRATDAAGRPVSRVDAYGAVAPLGTMPVVVEVPDAVAAELVPGAVVEVAGGSMQARMTGGDFGAVRVTITGGDEVAMIGDFAAIVEAA